jgi:hypothetical protein
MQQMILLLYFALFTENHQGVTPSLAPFKWLCLQQSPNSGPPARLDTVIGPNHRSVLVTLTERNGNYLLMKRVDDKSARTIISCLKESMRR